MLEGSPDEFLHKPIVKYLKDRGVEIFLGTRVLGLKYDTNAAG
jgi:zeta-carotene desaturase